MRPLLLVVLFLAAFAIAARGSSLSLAERPTFMLSPFLQLSGQIYADYTIGLAATQDMFVYHNAGEQSIVVMRRNNEGGYSRNATISSNGSGVFLQTNGRIIMSVGTVPIPSFVKVSESGETSEPSTIFEVSSGQLLSDDTFVGIDNTPNFDNTYTLHTYEYQPAYNNWTIIEAAELVLPVGATTGGHISNYRASDTHLVLNDYVSNSSYSLISIYERQPNKSWKFVDSFPANNSFLSQYPGSVTYNGVDTVVVSYPISTTKDASTYGNVQVFTKSNGVWVGKTYDAVNIGYRATALFGVVTIFLDPNTLLISAALEGYNINGPTTGVPYGGKVLMLTRDSNGLWNDTLDLIGDVGLFGLGVAANDYDILAMEATSAGQTTSVSILSAPRCFNKPINVTCYDQQLSDCSNIDISSLYTVNNPQCGQVDAALDNINIATGSNTIEATISFVRPTIDNTPVTCTASITCPAPPVTVNIVPVAVGAPTGRTSSALATKFGVINVLIMMAIVSLLQ